jgi:ubiquitin carboxyl-terminal hydrolase 4/11/15
MHNLPAPVPPTPGKQANVVKLSSCFSFFAAPEVLDENNKWLCPNCREFVCARKTLDIWSVADVMVIQLKRFVGGGRSLRKLETFVDFPDEIDMAEHIVGPQKMIPCSYRLYAVSNHMGGLGGGHYTAHALVQNPKKPLDPGAKWYSFNDSVVTPVAEAPHTANAYILFYERIETMRRDYSEGSFSSESSSIK